MTEEFRKSSIPAVPRITTRVMGGDGVMHPVAMAGAYEGASRNADFALWSPSIASADTEILHNSDTLVARSRDLNRNSPLIAAGVTTVKDGVVGDMYMLSAKPKLSLLGKGFDETWEAEFQQEVEELFWLYGESQGFFADAERRKTVTEIIRLGLALNIIDGEFFGAFEWTPDRPFATSFQVVDRTRIATPPGYVDGKGILAGVEKGSYGEPVAYHICKGDPSDIYSTASAMDFRRIPARTQWGRLNILHVAEQLRASMTRGIPALVAGLKQGHMAHKIEDTTIQQQIMKTLLATSIESEIPDKIYEQIGAGSPDQYAAAIGGFSAGFMDSMNALTGGAPRIGADGPRIPIFHPGTKLNFKALSDAGPLGDKFEMSILRKIAAVLGISYEEFAHDYSNTTYSSARAALAQTWRSHKALKRRVCDMIANAIYLAFLEEAVQRGMLSSMPRHAKGAWLMERGNARLYAIGHAEWIGANRGQIDERRETQAALMRIEAGLSTQEDEAAALGRDWRSINRQRKREMMDRESKGVPIAGDPSAPVGGQGGASATQQIIDALEDNLDAS